MTHNEPWVSPGSATPGASTRRAGRARPTRSRPRTTCCSRTAGRSRRSAARSPDAEVGITLNLAHAYPASDTPEDEAAAWQIDGEGEPLVPRSALPRRLPGRPARAERDRRAVRAGRRPRGDLGADRLPRRQQLLPLRRQRRLRRAADRAPTRRRSAPTWAGRSTRTGSTSCSSASRATTRRRAIYVTENGAAFGDVRVARRPRARPRADGVPRVAHRRGAARGRATARR